MKISMAKHVAMIAPKAIVSAVRTKRREFKAEKEVRDEGTGEMRGVFPATKRMLLALPVFHKDDTPQTIDDGIDNRISAEQEPTGEP
jgi:hypothetical protein